MRTLFYKRGTAIMFSSGEYSDYGPCGCIVTIKDCDLVTLVKEYRAAKDEEADPDRFASWLVASGYAMPAELEEVHLGSYGEFHGSLLREQA